MSRTNLLIIVGLVLAFAVIQSAAGVYFFYLDVKKGHITSKILGDTTSSLLFTLGLAWVWKKIYSRKKPDGQIAKGTTKSLLKILLGGFVGGIAGIGMSVAVTYLAVLVYSDDPSAGSIGGVLPILFVPLGILIGMTRAAKNNEEAEPDPNLWTEMTPEKDMLLVCAGSGADRMPFVTVPRAAGAEAAFNDCWLTFCVQNRRRA